MRVARGSSDAADCTPACHDASEESEGLLGLGLGNDSDADEERRGDVVREWRGEFRGAGHGGGAGLPLARALRRWSATAAGCGLDGVARDVERVIGCSGAALRFPEGGERADVGAPPSERLEVALVIAVALLATDALLAVESRRARAAAFGGLPTAPVLPC